MSTDVVGAYATAAGKHPRALARALVRTKSRTGRAVLAALATDRRASAAQLEDVGRRYRQGERATLALDPARTVDYARVLAVQTDDPSDRTAALGLLQWVLDGHRDLLDEREATLLLQLAVRARDFALADAVLGSVPVAAGAGRLAAADLANPWVRGGDETRWLAELNSALFGPDVVQAGLLADGDTPFDRLTTTSTRRVAHERRITVVISCYNPDRHLLTAVRSVLEQTWQNIELFVVDDASPAPLPGVLEEVERMDPRVRVIRKAVNGGTYRARNTALRQATGDFFTCLDSDDWAHPQRLELGVRPMIEDESLVATRSLGVRATEEMELGRVGYGGRFKAASSLMIRTFPVVNRLGFFDPVRKAADNEYAARVEAAFDGRVIDVPSHALTILLADAGSLSASDYSSGWRHPARSEYSESYSAWHRQVQWRDTPAFVPPYGRRAFPAPRRWERHPQDGPEGPLLDAVVVADWREDWLRSGTLERLHGLLGEGRRVGVVHHETLVDAGAVEHPVAPELRELLQRGEVERVYLDDARDSRLTIVADPRVLQFPPLLSPRLTSDAVWLVADREAEAAGQYARGAVEEHAREVLGTAPQWSDDGWPATAREAHAPLVGGSGSVRLPALEEPSASGDLEVSSWPLREPADGWRGARLSIVHRSGLASHGPEVRELSEAWGTSTEPWAVAAARWLERRPDVWAAAVQTSAEVRLVVAAGVGATVSAGAAVELERPATAADEHEVLVWRGGAPVERHTVATT